MALQFRTPGIGAGDLPAPTIPGAADRRTETDTLLARVENAMHDLSGTTAPSAAQRAALHHLRAGGGRFRARLAIDAGLSLGIAPARIAAVAAAVELVHNASLIHDDLQDRDDRRRGRASIWVEFGDAVAVSAGDLMLSAAYGALAAGGSAAASLVDLLHQRIREMIRGQDSDLTRPDQYLDLAEYETIAAGKSGPLLILPLEMSLVLAGRDDQRAIAAACGRHFAIGYQMFDDLRDVAIDRAGGALNAVLVLTRSGHSSPGARVTDLAIGHFHQADTLSRSLPADCGRLLARSARKLSRQLTGDTRT
ncbi:MAG: polyprenyl synthetase family protein [Wenzhouxiangella sp.]|nr:MAG: polyprenyl synthetase family protein [Wenzhouxiangella sp.]